MSIVLLYRSGPMQGRREEFDQSVVRLGRKPGNDVVLSDTVVSSFHAEIHRKGSQCGIVDLESTNGTFVNGERVGKASLHNGDRLQFGEKGPVLEFRSAGAESAEGPQLVPLSGSWEGGRHAIVLAPGRKVLGRSTKSDVVVGHEQGSVVSGEHAEVRFDGRTCELEDLNSTNGTFVNGARVRAARLYDQDRVELGDGGPVFEVRWPAQPRRSRSSDSEQMFRKLQRASKGGPAGERTMMFLQAANRYYRRRRWPLILLSAVVVIIAAAAGVLYYRERQENKKLRTLAANVFYQIRSLDIEVVAMRQKQGMSAELQGASERKERLKQEYDHYLESLGLYVGRSATEKEVMRMARELGETDLEVPPDFYKLAMAYVEKWRKSAVLRESLERARQTSLLEKIRVALNQQGLPRQFLFIALQESRFDAKAVGRPTNYGFAKGMWQFIPGTARDLGLQLGPLKDQQIYDPMDERHNELKSINAAARYLAYLYSTKAAASGLLVIASYNYGNTRIINKLDELPNDPRARNFWNFYRNRWLPDETRDYVMNIFSAAMICEKPDVFDFAMQPIR